MDVSKEDIEKTINILSSVKELERVKDFWVNYQVLPASAAASSVNWLDEFVNFLSQDLQLIGLSIKTLVQNELKEGSTARQSLFRENSIGLAIITTFWYKKGGHEFLHSIVKPLVHKIGTSTRSLEVDSNRAGKGVNVKSNSAYILNTVSQLLDSVFKSIPSGLFPKIFQMILQVLDSMVSLKFSDIGLSIVGGIMFLRLINPAIVSPIKYKLMEEVTPEGQRGLLIISKILQRLANEEFFNEEMEPHMAFANRWIKKTLPKWRSIFYEFMTGKSIEDSDTSVTIEITPEDLIAKSNQDVYKILVCPIVKSKQREILTRIFHLEKETHEWKTKEIDGSTVRFKKFKYSSIAMLRVDARLNAPVDKVLDATSCLFADPTESLPGACQKKVLKSYNENLSILHSVFKSPIGFEDRDFVTLSYWESLPEENFAIRACTSIEKDEYPKEPGYVRGELMGGLLLRGIDNNTTQLTHIMHVDLKGNAKIVPGFSLKKSAIKASLNNVAALKQLLA